MSSPRRRGLPKKKPTISKQQDLDDELPILEAVDDTDDLPLLEPIEEEPAGPVRVQRSAASDGFDCLFEVAVDAMDKKDVPAAVQGPLERAVVAAAGELRFRSVLVRFAGEALIGSAMKEQVANLLRAYKPARVVVRRGFGDEVVLAAAVPELPMELVEAKDEVKVTWQTAGLDQDDLAALLPARLQQLALAAKDRRYSLLCQGGAKFDATLRELAASTLQAAGARRAAVGARVLFDRDLLDRVQLQVDGDAAQLRITPAAEAAITEEALHLVLPTVAPQVVGRQVRIHAAGELRDAERKLAVSLLAAAAPQRIVLATPGAEEVLWPPVLQLTEGEETQLQVQPHGRVPAAVLASITAELPFLLPALQGKSVCVDWPAGFVVDAAAEAALSAVVPAVRQLACTVAGAAREPFHPLPLQVDAGSAMVRIELNTDAGKPPELVRVVERRLPVAAAQLRGQAVRVVFAGKAAASRTLQRALFATVEAAGCARLEVESRDLGGKTSVDVVLPPLLTITQNAEGVRLAAVAGGREPAQVTLALARELDAASLPMGCRCTVQQSSVTEALVAALVARGAQQVLLDGPAVVQVHPPLLLGVERAGKRCTLRAAPAASDEAALQRQLDRELPSMLKQVNDWRAAAVVVVWPGAGDPPTGALQSLVARLVALEVATVELDAGDGRPFQVHPPVPELELEPAEEVAAPAAEPAADPVVAAAVAPAAAEVALAGAATPSALSVLLRRDESVPPLLVLGVACGSTAAQQAAVLQELQQHAGRCRGRAVLVVLQRDGADVPVRRADPFATSVAGVLAGSAAATLLFRGPDAAGRPHFQVLHSSLRALPVGANFGDPRQPRARE